MNTNDRGQNHAEARHFKAAKAAAAHRGYPDARCACAGTGYVAVDGAVVPCPEHVLAAPVPVPRVSDPRGLPDVDWETVAGHALRDLQAAATELKRLRGEMPTDALRKYDRRYHAGA